MERVNKIWDRKWSNLNVAQYVNESLESDLWTIHHKPIIDKYLRRLDENAVFLEAGCGMGQWCFYASKKYRVKAIGVDIAEETINKLKDFCSQLKIDLVNFVIDDLNCTKLPNSYCDMFISLGVIEHFKDSNPMMYNLYRLLKPGGIGIITVPNIYSIHTITRPISKMLGKWDIGYEKSFSPRSLKELAAKNGFNIVEYGVLPSGQIFGLFLSHIPIMGNMLRKTGYWIENKQNTFGFISFVVVGKDSKISE